MEVRRLRPSEGAAKAIVDVVTRVKHLETRPSGTIYVDDTIISVDPETGREIHFGILPDGTVGFDPFVNDVTPPGVPSTPKVTGVMGGLEVWWDGKETGGSAQPDDYSHTDIEYSANGGGTWTLGGTFTNANSTTIGNLTVGTTYHIRLISYDKNKNASEPSTVVSGVPVSYVDNEDVENALEELRQSDRDNASAAYKAQESAGKAHDTATSAGEAALKAAGIANGKGRIIYADTAPTATEDKNVNNLWVDTSGLVPKNTPHRWDEKTAKWVVVTDKAALDAGIKAGNAEQIANAASAAAAAAATAAGQAQTSANEKNRVWYLPTAPVGNDHKEGDTWFDTSNGNMIHRWTGTEWVSAQDAFIAKADKKAADAAAAAAAAGTTATNAATAAENAAKAAGAKGKVIIQNGAPDAADRLPQNLWIDTTGGANTPKRWNGNAWVAVTDKKATDAADAAVEAKDRADEAFNLATTAAETAGQAQKSADGKNRVWYSDTAPTGTSHRVGDTWFDASMDNMPKVWDGTAWISVQDKSIAKADKKAADAATAATAAGTTATNAQTAADNAAKAAGAKGKVIIQSTAPDAADRLPQNLWIDTTGGKNTPKRWVSGTTWTAVTDKAATDAADAAVAAQSKAEEAFLLAGSAADAAGLAQESADGKNKVWYSTTAPTGTLHRVNDLWFDEANGNRPMRWDGAKWVSTQDQVFKAIEQNVEKVTTSANGKNSIYYAATAPTNTTAKPLVVGDTWFDTTNGNRVKVWSGGKWNDAVDKAITDAAAAVTEARRVADGKNAIYYETSEPASTTTRPLVKGDTWFNSSKNYQMSTWTGSKWQLTQDSNAALSAANGKNKVSTGATAPASPIVGDMWIDTAKSNQIKIYGTGGWTDYDTPGIITADVGVLGSAVVGTAQITDLGVTTAKIAELAVTDAKIGSINAGKIIAGEIDAARIGAKTITVDKLLVSSTDNLIQDADFSDPKGTVWGGGYSAAYSWDENGGRNSGPALKIAASTAQQGRYNAEIPAEGGSSYRVGVWVKSSVAAPVNSIVVYCRQKYVGGGTAVTAQLMLGNTEIIPANTWKYVSGIVKLREDAMSMAWGIFVQPALSTGNVWFDFVGVTRATDGALVVDGSISSDSIVTAGLDAGKITFGEMDGLRIKAGTIDTSRLLVGAIDNLVANPTMADGRGWSGGAAGTGSTFTDEVVFPGMVQSYKMTQKPAGSTSPALYNVMPTHIPVTPGEAFYVSSNVYTTGASEISSVSQRVYFYDANQTMLSGTPGNQAAGDALTTVPKAKTWVEVGGQVVAPVGAVSMAPRLTVYYPNDFTPSSAVWYVAAPKVYRAAGTTLIEKGAVTTDHMTAGTIDGKIITAGTIKGTQIEAKSISTDNLLITSTDNLIQEADFGAKGLGWKLLGTTAIDGTNGRNGGPALKITAASGLQQIYNKYTAAVEPGNVYRLTTWVKSTVALPVKTFCFMATPIVASGTRSGIRVYNTDASGVDKIIAANTWTKVTGLVTIPDNTATLEFALELAASVTTGTIYVDFASVTRATDGELVVDGSITTNSMTAGAIDAKVLKAGTISGSQIMAKTITTDSLLISSTDNLIQEADFSAKGIGWKSPLPTGVSINASAGRSGGPALRFTGSTAYQTAWNKYTGAADPGAVYRFNMWFKSTVALPANTIRLGMAAKNAAGTTTNLSVYNTAVAANTWARLPIKNNTLAVPVDAATFEIFIEASNSFTSGTIDVDFVSVTRAMDAELVVDGSITTESITSGGIDAAVIKAGTLDAARIGAQTITAEKMIIGQGANLISDPMFLNDASNALRASRSTGTWTFGVDTSTGITNAKTTTATTNNAFMFGLTPSNAANAANMIPTQPGSKYFFDASVYTNISCGVRWNIYEVKADGTVAYRSLSTTNTAMGRRPIQHEYVVPAGIVAFTPVLACLATGVTWVIDGGPSVSLKVEGNLIVDGALTGKVITGALIETLAADNRGIKLNADGMIAYNNSGVETLRFSGNTATITGATLRTAATGARVIMDATGLKAYPATGSTPYLSATSAGLEVTGTLRTMGTSTGTPGTITSILGPTVWGLEANGQTTGGLGFYASALELQQDSPPHIASLDGRAVTLNGMQRSSGNMAARLSVTDNYEVNIEGDLLVTGRIKTTQSAGMHWEWSKNGVVVPHNTLTGPGVPTFDADQSPVQSHPNKPNLYKNVLSFNSAGEMIFKEAGTYLVDLKVAMQATTKGVSWVAIQQYNYSSQISYAPAGVLDMTVSGSFYFPEPNMKLSLIAVHQNGVNVPTNWRIKVTLLN